MLHLLQPIWLLASAGILIPVAIHLWNIKEGKTLKIGSIQLLARTAQQHARSLRLTELFLLLLRCLLILLLALLLAKPYWQNTAKQKGWVVVEKKNAAKIHDSFQPLIDSLSNAGFGFHFFEKGFAETKLAELKTVKADTGLINTTSYWQLVTMLDRQLPSGMPVYLFTENKMERFAGDRPEINIALTWKTFSSNNTKHSFIAQAYETSNESIAVVMGESGKEGVQYHTEMIAVDQPKQRDFVLSVADGNMQVAYQSNQPIAVDTSTLRISIFAGGYPDDARYVQAAIQSIQQVTGRKIIFKNISSLKDISVKQDWLFWLSDEIIAPQVDAVNVFFYAKGKTVATESMIQDGNDSRDKAELYQRISYGEKSTNGIWRDGFGVPLLVKEKMEAKTFYKSYTHLNPSWNELVWSASFPQVIYQLINDQSEQNIGKDDHRAIDETQLQWTANTSAKKKIIADEVDTTGTKQVLWVIIFIFFCLERYFSFRIRKVKTNA